MKRFKEEPLSTLMSLVLFIAAFVFLFVDTNYDIPLWGIGSMIIASVLLAFAKDKVLDILTLGLSRLVTDFADKVKKKG